MKRSRIILALNALIVVSMLAGVAVLALIGIGGVSSVSSFSIGSPTTTTAGGATHIQVPLTIGNGGSFGYSGIDVQVDVKDSAGDQLLTGSLGPFDVPAGQTKTVNASLVLDTSKLSQQALQELATTSQNLTVGATLAASEPPFVGVSGAVSAQLAWGAPVSGLKEGTPSFSQYNSTTIEVKVPVSFSNQNQFLTISGNGLVSVLNSSDARVGSGSVSLYVPPNAQFDQVVDLFVELPSSQLQSLLTTDQNIAYTAALSILGGALSGFSLSTPIAYQWGAPFSGLSVGSPVVSAYNSTHYKVSVPLSFADHSASIGVSTVLRATLVNSTSGAAVGSGALPVQASPGTSFSNDLVMYVKVTPSDLGTLFFNDATVHFTAQISGSSGGVVVSFSKSFDVPWGAPASSLKFGTLSAGLYNSTYSQFSTSFNFTDNSAFISLNGDVSGTITDLSGNIVGYVSPATVTVNAGEHFAGSLTGYIRNTALGQSSYVLHLTFQTPFGTVTKLVTVNA
ncbi:MAG: LEA type 2 family protein [Thaumarchaeota archaeon]|nr:LEA type 2 family protein [Nitrososphaerota archaeon]